jgi:hypothetical protein
MCLVSCKTPPLCPSGDGWMNGWPDLLSLFLLFRGRWQKSGVCVKPMPASVSCCMLSDLLQVEITAGEGCSNLCALSTNCGVVVDGICFHPVLYDDDVITSVCTFEFYLEVFIRTSKTTQEQEISAIS